MVTALKTASEMALDIPIEAVTVTAPSIAAWDDQMTGDDRVPGDSVVNDVIFPEGLELLNRWASSKNHFCEINTVLISEKRWVCLQYWCSGHGVRVAGEASRGGPAFLSG